MAFDVILKSIVDGMKGSLGCTLMGVDGIAIQEYKPEGAECDIETLGIEYGKITGEIKSASAVLNLGDVEEVMVTFKGTKVILRLVTEEYFLAHILGPGANFGKARYLLKKAARQALKELT